MILFALGILTRKEEKREDVHNRISVYDCECVEFCDLCEFFLSDRHEPFSFDPRFGYILCAMQAIRREREKTTNKVVLEKAIIQISLYVLYIYVNQYHYVELKLVEWAVFILLLIH